MSRIDVFSHVADLSLPDAALRFISEGVPVFPCVPGEKRPLVRHGFHEATTDVEVVAGWWKRWPSANIGVPTGPVSGLDVVDVDVAARGTGYPVFREAHQRGYATGWEALIRTPSGGLHAYFPADADQPQSSWQVARAHIDFRGAGGYVIAPPSVINRPDGVRAPYRLIVAAGTPGARVDAVKLRRFLDPSATLPVRPPVAVKARPANPSVLAEWVAERAEGERNRGLFWAACRLAEAGTPSSVTLDALGPAAEQVGLQPREIIATIRSAYRTNQGPVTRSSHHSNTDLPRAVQPSH